jgi:hypothetical protein
MSLASRQLCAFRRTSASLHLPFRNCFKACLYPRVNWKISIRSPIPSVLPLSLPSRAFSLSSNPSHSNHQRYASVHPSSNIVLPFFQAELHFFLIPPSIRYPSEATKTKPTFPDLQTNCRRELIDSEFFADLDFLTGAIVVDIYVE